MTSTSWTENSEVPSEPPLRVHGLGLPDDVTDRLSHAGADIVEESSDADAVVVSTRSLAQAHAIVDQELHGCPVVVLAHTGGERAAADLVRSGAWAILGEGNEHALWSLVDSQRISTTLLSSFERRFGVDRRSAGHGVDSATGLPDVREFDRRLSAFVEADRMPSVAHLRVVSERWGADPTDVVVGIQRRRLASALAHECASVRAEAYATGPNEFTVLAERLDTTATRMLCQRLVDAGATFRDRGLALRVVVGHAEPESNSTIDELLDRARRASEVASADGQQAVLGAGELERGVSETTELEAIMRLLDDVEPSLAEGRGHGERVGRITAELARLLAVAPSVVSKWHLAGHLHDIGRAGLPAGAVETGALDGELLDAWRTFPARSAQMLRVAAGPDISEVVRAQREHFDGTGFPEGASGEDIPYGARVLSVAHAIDEVASTSHHADQIIGVLRQRAGTQLDPVVSRVAVQHMPTLLAARR